MLGGMLLEEVAGALASAGVGRGRLLVAVSGGRDSMLLLALLEALAHDRMLDLCVAHVHHGLRGAEADADARFVEERARASGLPFYMRRVDPRARREAAPSSRSRPTIEEAARDLRRAALTEMAREAGARWVALAHHAGDQAETVLLRILRGTGADGLAAMSPISSDGFWVRPLLGVRPEEVARAADARGLRWREDGSNRDLAFARNRLRNEWMPGLSDAFGTDLLRNLVHLADAVRDDLEWIEGQVDLAAAERIEIGPDGIRLALDGWDALPDALGRRLVRRVLLMAGLERSVSGVHLARVLAFLRRGRTAGRDLRLELPLGAILRRLDEVFLFQIPTHREDPRQRIPDGGDATVPRRD